MLFDSESFLDLFDVSRETINRLELYSSLLVKWNSKINLVAESTLKEVWERHFADSAQLWSHVSESDSLWLDFGSGAGFPGLVCAVIAREKRPEFRFILVESDQRKCAFLMSVVRELDLNVEVMPKRIESITRLNPDIISARAVATLERLLEVSALHAHKSTVLLFQKGRNYKSELTAAQNHWHIGLEVIQSLADDSSVILRIEGFKRAKQ